MRVFAIVGLCVALVSMGACASTSGSASGMRYLIGSSPRDDGYRIVTTGAAGEIKGRATLGQPIALPGRDTCIVPFSMKERKGFFQDRDPYTRGGYGSSWLERSWRVSSYPGGEVRWHNAVVCDLSDGAQRMILKTWGVITRFQALGPPQTEDGRLECQAILFVATIDDTNADGYLNDRDATVVIVSRADGSNARVISPRDAQVRSIAFDYELNVLYLMVTTDTNSDGKLTFADESRPYVYRIGADRAEPVVTPESGEAMQAIMR